jgi:AcrR family transcriptional regulator
LHYYFNTKEALIRAVVDYLVHQFLTLRAPLPDDSPATAPQKLRRLFLDLRYQLAQAPQLFIVWTELHLRSQRDPMVRAILKNLNDGWQTQVESICREGLQQQLFRPDLDPHRAAAEVIALIKGISLQAVSQLDTFDFDRLSADMEQWFSNPKVVAVSPRTFIPNRGGRKGT